LQQQNLILHLIHIRKIDQLDWHIFKRSLENNQ